MKKALVTGITGQDGSYLAELLLEKGYEVHGLVRPSSTLSLGNIERLCEGFESTTENLHLVYGDLTDANALARTIRDIGPEEIYNLGAQSHVRVSYDTPLYTSDATGLGVVRLLEAIRESGVVSKFYQASTSEMFGKVRETPQTEEKLGLRQGLC